MRGWYEKRPVRLQVSPSGRATCRTCETRIERGALRVAATSIQFDQTVERYHHLTCVVEDDPNGAMIALLAAPPELRTAAERALGTHRAFLESIARAAAGKAPVATSSSDEFDAETETLLTQLAPNPRDEALLSVLQDHLQDRGLPRGELIALELAKAPETARLVELKRQLWPVVKDVRVTWGTGFLRTMSVTVRDQESSAAPQALSHPSARLLEELALQRWVGPLPPVPASLRRLEFQWCQGASASVSGLEHLRHLQLNHVEDAEEVQSASLTSLGFGPDVVAVPRARLVPHVDTLVISAPESIDQLQASGLLKQARVLVFPDFSNGAVVDTLARTGGTWEQLVVSRFRPDELQRQELKRLARRAAVMHVAGVPQWVTHTSRPEWGLGRVRTRTDVALEVEFDSGVRTFAPNAPVLMGVEVLDPDAA